MIQLQEHDQLIVNGLPIGFDEKYNNLNLIQWDKPLSHMPWGYYASFKIGAEWINDKEALIVTTKEAMCNIDFLRMFMTCFSSDLALESFSEIYKLELDKPQIQAPALSSIVSHLIVAHFISIINRIKSLKKGYISRQDNLKKVKGHIKILKNERYNIATKRYDRVYCEYNEFSVDIPENRLLKKAVLFSQAIINNMASNHQSYSEIRTLLSKALKKFENVSDNVDIKSVDHIRSHKLYTEYSEAIRLAKLILKQNDYSINKASTTHNKVTPFVLDMSLLYEHYVYGLLNEAYGDHIVYQFKGKTGFPDFLYKSQEFKAILDTKYKPKYNKGSLDTYVVRQLSGYSRDLLVLKELGYTDILEDSPSPSVPCIIIYPTKDGQTYNPFKTNTLSNLCTRHLRNLSMFYKLSIPIPTL